MSVAAFQDYFSKIYGSRWPDLYEALRRPEKQVAWVNTLGGSAAPPAGAVFLENCLSLESGRIQPERTEEGLLNLYILDPASVIVARALEVQAGDRVLDMCAAPGGKSLVLLENLRSGGELFANDLSPERRERLKKVIQQYVPRDFRNRVWVTGKDGVQFGLKEPEGFDRILLDAPCSGERHVLENEKALAEWSPRRGEHLAGRQYALLAAALLAAKRGARIVYSTCSINPAENDGVFAKMMKKKKDQARVLPAPMDEFGETTEFGRIFLPDRCGFGPLYFAVAERI